MAAVYSESKLPISTSTLIPSTLTYQILFDYLKPVPLRKLRSILLNRFKAYEPEGKYTMEVLNELNDLKREGLTRQLLAYINNGRLSLQMLNAFVKNDIENKGIEEMSLEEYLNEIAKQQIEFELSKRAAEEEEKKWAQITERRRFLKSVLERDIERKERAKKLEEAKRLVERDIARAENLRRQRSKLVAARRLVESKLPA